MVTRAYSLITVKSFDDDKRVFRGIATTPTPDRVNDVVESLGVTFRNPLPLLLHHDQKLPVGTVNFKTPTANGVEFEATIATVADAGVLKDRTDEAWQSVQAGIIRGVSIGFRPVKSTRLKSGGIHFTKSEVFELSLVTVPANTDATIQLVKSLDQEHLHAASGTKKEKKSAGVSATQTKGNKTTMNFAEMLAELQTKKADLEATLDDFVTKGLTDLSDDENTAYDEAEAELVGVVKAIDRLTVRMGEAVAKATPIKNVKSFATGSAARARVPATVAPTIKKGEGFTMLTMALAAGRGNLMQSATIADRPEFDRVPAVREILKSAVAAGTTSDPAWAKPLVQYQTLANEFIELIRAESILGRINGLRRVPFNVRVSSQTSGSTVNWVAEGKLKPVSKLGFDEVKLGFNKLAGIVTVSDELIKFADQNVISIVQNDLVAATAEFLDDAFLNPAYVASGSNPASVTNGVTAVAASGKTVDHLKADVKKVFGAYLASGLPVTGSYWVMSGVQALAISMLTNAIGQREFPELSMTGGTFFGLPVIVSEAPVTAGRIALVKANEIFLAEDGIVLDSSREASIVMDSDPNRAGAPTAVSMWQSNQVAIRVEQFINWQKRRPGAVALISDADYGGIAA